MPKLCIIPARGGSKRIPKKNVKNFLGKPIIAYSIEAAIKSNLFDVVMVSTDDHQIAEVANKYGAEVPFFRSEKNSSDFATTYDVIEEVLDYYQSQQVHFDQICTIYPCAPFINPNILSEALNLLLKESFDTVFPVMKYSFPIQRAVNLDNGKLSWVSPKFALARSQDLTDSYHDAGQFYWSSTNSLKKNKKIVTNYTGGVVISELQGQDIDNELDWKLAELKYKLIHEVS